MKADYLLHEQRYTKIRGTGQPGWDDAQTLTQNLTLWERRMQAAHLPRQGRILELGCGAGNLTLWMAERGYEVHGIDIAPTAIAWAKENAARQSLQADFRLGDVRDLACYADETFDLVLDGHCYHCIIGEDRPRFLAAARRVLKPGGALLILTMCGAPTENTWNKTNYIPELRCQLYGDIALRYFVELDELLSELVQAGFEIGAQELIPCQEADGCDSLAVDAVKTAM